MRLSPEFSTRTRKHQLKLLALLAAPLLGSCLQAQVSTADLDDKAPVLSMDSLEVTGSRPSFHDSTALKLDARLLETPRSVSLIDDARIREQDFQNGADLMFWVPGMNTNGESYHYYARGYRMLPTDWKVDGFPGRVLGGSYSPNLFGVESVSLLKGPAGLLYGAASSPGGQVNLITKKPKTTASTLIETRIATFAGSDSSLGDSMAREFSIDSTGPVGNSKRFFFRYLGDLEYAAPKPGLQDENQFHRFSFTALLDEAGNYRLTPVFEWSREHHETRGGYLSPSSSRTTADGRTDYTLDDLSARSVNLGAGGRVDDNLTLGTDLDARFTKDWKAALAFRYHEREYTNSAWTTQTATLTKTSASDPYSWTVQRRHARARGEYADLGLDANTTWEFLQTEQFKSLVQGGVNLIGTNTGSFTGTTGTNQSAINIYTGVAASPLVADAAPIGSRSGLTKATAWNLYLQSQTSFRDRLIFTLSAAQVGDRTLTYGTSGSLSSTVSRNGTPRPNASLVYLLTPKISTYVSYSTSYSLPNATYQDATGNTGNFDPTEGENLETGVKAELISGLLAASVSVFDLKLNNVLVQSATNELNSNLVQYYRQLDSGRKSRGAEVEFTLSPVKAWSNTFTYAYIDAYNRNSDGSQGARAEMTPRHAVSIYSRYAFKQGALSGWNLHGGFIWQDERIGGNSAPTAAAPDPLFLRSFHRFDAGVGYEWHAWSYALNVENLTDELYAVTGSTGLNIEPSNPRTLAFRVGYHW